MEYLENTTGTLAPEPNCYQNRTPNLITISGINTQRARTSLRDCLKMAWLKEDRESFYAYKITPRR